MPAPAYVTLAQVTAAMADTLLATYWSQAMEVNGRDGNGAMPKYLREDPELAAMAQADAWRLLGLYERCNGDLERLLARADADAATPDRPMVTLEQIGTLLMEQALEYDGALERTKVPQFTPTPDIWESLEAAAETCNLSAIRKYGLIVTGQQGKAEHLVLIESIDDGAAFGHVVNGGWPMTIDLTTGVATRSYDNGTEQVLYTSFLHSIPDINQRRHFYQEALEEARGYLADLNAQAMHDANEAAVAGTAMTP